MKVTVKVPASSANLGSGVDTLGLALSLYLTATFETASSPSVRLGRGFDGPLDDKDNFVLVSARTLFQKADVPYPALAVTIETDIPMARGLGSSSAAIIAGLEGANALLGGRFSQEELLETAASLEGHPDNVVPACAGGFTMAMTDSGKVFYRSFPAPDMLFVAAVPAYRLKTETARAVLPSTLPRQTAISQLQRACFLTDALIHGGPAHLALFTRDMIFTPARSSLMPGSGEAMQAAMDAGAFCSFVSGAGPTVLAMTPRDESSAAKVAAAMQGAYRSQNIEAKCLLLTADNLGSQVIIESD